MHGGEENSYRVLVAKPEEKRKDYFEDLIIGGRIILQWILKQ
jgi:hypothetical protein